MPKCHVQIELLFHWKWSQLYLAFPLCSSFLLLILMPYARHTSQFGLKLFALETTRVVCHLKTKLLHIGNNFAVNTYVHTYIIVHT